MRILFISTHNLATNPRLVKEIELALANGFSVEVVCFIFRNWSYAINEQMIERLSLLSVSFHCIEAGREAKMQWLQSVCKEKLYRFISNFIGIKDAALATAVSRRNYLLLKALKKVKQADWVIGHNPGALWATQVAADKLQCRAGFDVEDYHPGEGHQVQVQKLTLQLMQELLPKMDYVTFASPLIKEAVKKDLQGRGLNGFTVLNYFPGNEFVQPETNITGPLKLVWFSQNINEGRGLELILPSIKKMGAALELHLYGNVNEIFSQRYLTGANNIFLHGAISQQQLHKELAKYDVGLALEVSVDYNRTLVITNKLLSYLQAGLYVLASNTTAQQQFMQAHPEHGIVTDITDAGCLQKSLDTLIEQKKVIRSGHQQRYIYFKKYGWENESSILLKLFN